MENVIPPPTTSIDKSDRPDDNNKYNKRQEIFLITLWGIGLVICCILFYWMIKWFFVDPTGFSDPIRSTNFMMYAPMSMFGLMGCIAALGFAIFCCAIISISGILDLLE